MRAPYQTLGESPTRSRYRINPAGVVTVLEKTSTEAGEFATLVTPMEGHASAAIGASGDFGAISTALGTFFETQTTRLEGMAHRVDACLTGAFEATKAYDRGDEDMVGAYQRNAVLQAGLGPR